MSRAGGSRGNRYRTPPDAQSPKSDAFSHHIPRRRITRTHRPYSRIERTSTHRDAGIPRPNAVCIRHRQYAPRSLNRDSTANRASSYNAPIIATRVDPALLRRVFHPAARSAAITHAGVRSTISRTTPVRVK